MPYSDKVQSNRNRPRDGAVNLFSISLILQTSQIFQYCHHCGLSSPVIQSTVINLDITFDH